MAFAQLSFRERIRDIEAGLLAQRLKLYRLGIRAVVSRNTFSFISADKNCLWR